MLVEMMFKVHNSHPDVFKQAGAVVKEICKIPQHAKVRNSTWLYTSSYFESLACCCRVITCKQCTQQRLKMGSVGGVEPNVSIVKMGAGGVKRDHQ